MTRHAIFFRVLILTLFFLSSRPVQGQNIFWTEDFNNNCNANCLASSYNGWTIIDNDGGTTGASPNDWFVSCAEEGVTPPGCGSTCIGDASLHISSNPGGGGDMGATFNETGATNATYRTVVSPIINATGLSNITLLFDFIAYGSSACSDDRAQLRLSFNGGATWPVSFQYCLSSSCCGSCNGYSQGQWTQYQMPLPNNWFDNNPNIRIGFNWRNNGNGSGTDPSVAIDDIRLSTPTPLPANLLSFDAVKQAKSVKISWITAQEVNVKHFEIERSLESLNFKKIGTVKASGNQQSSTNSYSFQDAQVVPGAVYYRLKTVDLDGNFKYSKTVRVISPDLQDDIKVLSSDIESSQLTFNVWSAHDMPAVYYLYDMQGRILKQWPASMLKKGVNSLNLTSLPSMGNGYYVLKIVSLKAGQVTFAQTTSKFMYTGK